MARSTIADWIQISRNLNQIHECYKNFLHNLESRDENTVKQLNSLTERIKTARKNLGDRFKEEYPEMSGASDFIKLYNSGTEWIYQIERQELTPKKKVDKTKALVGNHDINDLLDLKSAALIDNRPSTPLADEKTVSIGTDEETSMENWNEIVATTRLMLESLNNIRETEIPKGSYNPETLENSCKDMVKALNEQAEEEHGEKTESLNF